MLNFQHVVKTRCSVLLSVVALVACAAPALLAQQGDPVYKSGDPGVVSPRLTHSVQPGYTEEAKTERIMGVVTIAFEIDKEGKTRSARIEKGLDPGLDKNALAALGEWVFEPATKDGQPVVCAAKTEINFVLR